MRYTMMIFNDWRGAGRRARHVELGVLGRVHPDLPRRHVEGAAGDVLDEYTAEGRKRRETQPRSGRTGGRGQRIWRGRLLVWLRLQHRAVPRTQATQQGRRRLNQR